MSSPDVERDGYPEGHSPFCHCSCDHPCHDAYDDVAALRRSAAILEARGRPRGFMGRVLLGTMVSLLRDTATTIEAERPSWP